MWKFVVNRISHKKKGSKKDRSQAPARTDADDSAVAAAATEVTSSAALLGVHQDGSGAESTPAADPASLVLTNEAAAGVVASTTPASQEGHLPGRSPNPDETNTSDNAAPSIINPSQVGVLVDPLPLHYQQHHYQQQPQHPALDRPYGDPYGSSSRNLSLPDIDNVSMNNVFQYVENYEQDWAWSVLSDGLFLAGGSLYVALSIWDEFWPLPLGSRRNYYFLDVLAPTIYVINSVVDMEWAFQVKRRYKVKQTMLSQFDEWRTYFALDEDEDDPDDPDHIAAAAVADSPFLKWLTRIRKHAAHRRTIFAALTFGIAAVLGLVAVPLGYRAQYAGWDNGLVLISDHFYVLSAMIACTGKRTRPWLSPGSDGCLSSPGQLEDLGDLFFLVGSLGDVVLDDLNLDTVPRWSLVSSVLWLLDAGLYLLADRIMARRISPPRDPEHGGLVLV